MESYKTVLKYLYEQLPMFQRIGKKAFKSDLTTSLALDKYFDHPHKKFKSIHIGGTNGKGSIAHMVASVLQEAGYKTGLYTSPHLKDFRERIRINGKLISKKYIIDFVNEHHSFFEKLQPSFFEITAAMAFQYFANKKVDIAIIEVGLGGRLDSTNIIHPILSVISNISFDHVSFLGNSLRKIAVEKAGIIKKETPVVVGETQPGIRDIFVSKANELKSRICFADRCYQAVLKNNTITKSFFDVYSSQEKKIVLKNIVLDLTGKYQIKNLQSAITVLQKIQSVGFKLQNRHFHKGFSKITRNTGFKGRWQILGQHPLIIADTAHNTEGIAAAVRQIEEIDFNKLHIIFGLSDGKNINEMLKLLPSFAQFHFVEANVPRSINIQILAKKAEMLNLAYHSYKSVNHALEVVKDNASSNDMILITGSVFVIAEIV